MVRQFGTTEAARNGVVNMLQRDIELGKLGIQFDARSPDGDVAKFTINNKVARAIQKFNGYLVPINKDWFSTGDSLPMINDSDFVIMLSRLDRKQLTMYMNHITLSPIIYR